MTQNVALIAAGYLAGSVASAVLVCRLMGLADPRAAGSGNPGATNVLRLHGRRAAALVLAGDVLKGVIPVLAAKLLGAPDWVIALTAAAAFTGHLYPVYFRFRGGKGVATLVGVLLASHWPVGLAFIATWCFMAALTRFASVSSMTAAALTPVYTWILLPLPAYILAFGALAMLVIWRHRSNIRHLLDGTEDRIGADRS